MIQMKDVSFEKDGSFGDNVYHRLGMLKYNNQCDFPTVELQGITNKKKKKKQSVNNSQGWTWDPRRKGLPLVGKDKKVEMEDLNRKEMHYFSSVEKWYWLHRGGVEQTYIKRKIY